MAKPLYRLLGPNHNRILDVVVGDASIKCAPGQIIQRTAGMLQLADWKQYEGPGKAVAGWYVPDTDPQLRPTGRRDND